MEKRKLPGGATFIMPGISFIAVGISFLVIFRGSTPGSIGSALFIIAGISFLIAAAMNKSKS